ncbi:hypothetical protein CHLNCDRAFT_138420 [Chlorella variabilis]|uniref:DNA ligase n=1 Tax=Chlorella variabilis TaxID=554065 RepID=E1ZN08_CHLVA|nr:hypothetical protein CHLNCDRAFT_138420 [Chlorella variabilis]EFN52891.1 hypothetical protein CHLNCDRAFT_138420 [Chlorella variabilis]|eukprot:XP_005844993.1 hypothetical protein CHLNCDRAFT_138420 [Chlorella variabilis]
MLLPPNDLSFQTLVNFFSSCRKLLGNARKGGDVRSQHVKRFIDVNIDKESHQAFAVFRLILPAVGAGSAVLLDNKRGNYKLLESNLINVLLKAAGIDKKSKEASTIRNWKRPGSKSAGDFAAVLQENIFNVYCMIDPTDGTGRLKTLKVGQLNQALDKLVEAAGNFNEQANILRGLMQVTSPDQMAWIVQIILKNLKINVGEGKVLKTWHKDAETYYNQSGMDLEHIFNEMVATSENYATSIQPGKAVRPQLLKMTGSVKWAFSKAMHDEDGKLKEFVVEMKLDGERIQVHRGPRDEISYFSRRAIEHGEKSNYSVVDDMIRRYTRGPCVLDGELIVWNKKEQVFEPFGSLKPLISAILEQKHRGDVLDFNEMEEDAAIHDEDYKAPQIGDLELVYVTFDILHNGKGGVIDMPLRERHKMLEDKVVPGIPADRTHFGSILASRTGRTEEDISQMLQEIVRLREEGIVIKALDSVWVSNDRHSNNWLKVKPDYIANIELDCLVIGAWGGKGGRGGHYTQYLLALADDPPAGQQVGTGTDRSEWEAVHRQIEPLCIDASKHPPPCFYSVTGREKPEVWISDPKESVVVQISADLRTIRSTQFKTGYSLRFPKVHSVRWDKTATIVSSIKDLQGRVEEQKKKDENIDWVKGQDGDTGKKRRTTKRDKGPAAKRLRGREVVEVESSVLEGCHIAFANYGEHNKRQLEEIVKKLGGETRFMFTEGSGVTHILAGREDNKVKAHKEHDRDVISIDWLVACDRQKRRVPLRPRYYIHMSRANLIANPDVDSLGDSYMSDVDEGDVDNLLHRAVRPGAVDPAALAEGLAHPSEFEDSNEEQVAKAQRQLTRRLGSADAGRAVGSYLDAQLAAIGQLDPRFSCLRPFSAVLLRLGNGKAIRQPDGDSQRRLVPSVQSILLAGAASQARLQQLQAAAVAAEFRIMGGALAVALGQSVTHVLGLVLARAPSVVATDEGSSTGAASAVEPQALLRAVDDQAGGPPAVALLKLGLATGSIQLETDRWVHRCLDEAENRAAAGQMGTAKLPPEAAFLLDVANLDNPDGHLPQPPKRR